MAINFKRIAQQETVLSDIMTNRTKVTKTDGKIHICDFDIIASAKGEAYVICAINEDQFINGGFVLNRIFTAIVEEYHGDVNRAREDFREAGGIDVRLERKKTKDGHDITTVEVI